MRTHDRILTLACAAAILTGGACRSVQDGIGPQELPDGRPAAAATVEAFVEAESTHVGGGRGAGLRYEAGAALEVDLQPLGWTGTGLLIDVRSIRGQPVGVDSQGGASSLENPEVDALADAYLTLVDGGDGVAARAGILDGNRVFGAFDAVDGFLHAAAITPPTIVGLPAAPFSAPGLEVEAPWDGGDLAVGLFDAERAGVATTTAIGGQQGEDLRPRLGSTAVVQAAIDRDGSRATGGVHWNDGDGAVFGAYGMVEHRLFEQTTAFAMVGQNTADIDAVRQHVMAGVAWDASADPLVRTSAMGMDRIGALWSQTRADGDTVLREDAFEVFYRHRVGEGTTITISTQYLRGTGDGPANDDFVAGLRFSSSF